LEIIEINLMKSKTVLLHIFICICFYNLLALGFMQIDIWGTQALWCAFVIIGAFGLGFEVRHILGYKDKN